MRYKIDKIENQEDIIRHIDSVLLQLKDSILKMYIKRSKPLLYWLNDWGGYYLIQERMFNPQELIRYERGMVVQANLGFKVGSEQGGLHFNLVIEKNNDLSSPVVIVIPLRSLRENERPQDIDERFEVFLGYNLFSSEIERLEDRIQKLKEKNDRNSSQGLIKINKEIGRHKKLVSKLKLGSVAIVSQICALSKLRIYLPKNRNDFLSGFRIDAKTLDIIDNKLMELLIIKNNNKILESE